MNWTNCDEAVFEVAHKLIHHRYFWYHDGRSFADQMEFLMYISENHPELRHKQVTVVIKGVYNRLNKFIPDRWPKTYTTCLPQVNERKPPTMKRKTKVSSGGILVRYSVKGQTTYECNGRKVPTLVELAKCALEQRHIKFGATCSRGFYKEEPAICTGISPSKDKTLEQIFCEKPNTLYLVNFQKSLHTNSFSNKVWLEVWKDRLTYECFSVSNFFLLRKRFLTEMNIYRLSHKAPRLFEDEEMTKIAQERAMKIALSRNISSKPDKKYEELVGTCEVFLAPFMVKNWYDTITKTKYRIPILTGTSKAFVKMLWVKTRFIGIGIVKHHCHIFVVLIFKQRENKLLTYRKNIKKRKIKNKE